MDNQITLGQKIVTDTILNRVTTRSSPDKFGRTSRVKTWELNKLDIEKSVIVIGVRTLSNGTTDFDIETGYEYNPKEYFKALLVVSNLNKNPYFIPIQ